jgi:hypothetical protein
MLTYACRRDRLTPHLLSLNSHHVYANTQAQIDDAGVLKGGEEEDEEGEQEEEGQVRHCADVR